MPGFVLLARDRNDGDPAVRVGFTVTKKVGNAVVRNRMKRRMRDLAREALPAAGQDGCDYVLIGREGGIQRDYSALRHELAKALKKVASPRTVPAELAEPKSAEGRPSSISSLQEAEARPSASSVRAEVG